MWIADILYDQRFSGISLRNSIVKAFKDDGMIHSGSTVPATVFLVVCNSFFACNSAIRCSTAMKLCIHVIDNKPKLSAVEWTS